MPGFNMDDYVPVNERIAAFLEKHPEGSLQCDIIEMTEDRVTVKAYAYRAPDDPKPGTGLASEPIPGRTSFTQGSEVENAETSAWGRAIAALGFEVKRGIASREEMRRSQPQDGERAAPSAGRRAGSRQPATTRPAAQRTPEEQALIGQLLDLPGMTVARMELLAKHVQVKGERATADELREMLRIAQTPLDQPSSAVPVAPAGTGGEGSGSPSDSNATSEGSPASAGSDAATSEAGDSPPVASPPAAPSDAEILAAAGEGAEMVPPKPGTKAYRELPDGTARAQAKAYWDAHKAEPVQESLAAALGAPEPDR